MFRKRFIRRHRGPWSEGPGEPGFHRPDFGHAEEQEKWTRRVWPGHHFGGWHRPPFAWDEDTSFWFGPEDHDPFDRPFWRGGPFGGDPFDEDGGGRKRHRRGDIKYVLLELLAEQPRHGYDLIKELEQRYAGFYRPSPGSVYPTLQLLEDEGHLTSETIDGKRVYTITESGRQLLEERHQRGEADHFGPRRHGFRGRGGGPELNELRRSGVALIASVMQAARHGTPDQVQAVMKLIDTTRREIYAILAKGEDDRPG
jgi:DNA-binding PadR family transcriptional regulator